jgi:ABC-2 type transport system ATP-binding protein
LIGPNGAGKTTTLRALTGIIPPSRGTLRIAGFGVQQSPIETKRRLAYIPDDPQLFHDLTVEQHLAFAASAYRVDNAEARAEQLLTEFELAEKQHVPAGDLSRGMRQKLAICCGYLHDPSAILFDEPLTGLDPRGIRGLKSSIKSRARAGAAVIVSSHLLAMVEDICTHLLILDRGRQKFFGPIEDVRSSFSAEDETDATLEDIFFRATGAVEQCELTEA